VLGRLESKYGRTDQSPADYKCSGPLADHAFRHSWLWIDQFSDGEKYVSGFLILNYGCIAAEPTSPQIFLVYRDAFGYIAEMQRVKEKRKNF
jgi:hypothetical protein